MNIALIGYGYWGKILAKYLEQNAYFQLQAIFTSQPHVSKGISSLAEIESSEVEAVFIATPQKTHYDLCKRFLKAGKHVFCEKPFVAPILAIELYELADQMGKKLYVNYIYTCSASIQKMKALMPLLGEIEGGSFRLKQYGKFYHESNAFETLGCHMLSCYYFFFHEAIAKEKVLQSSEDKLSQKLTLAPTNIVFDISLMSKEKQCLIKIEGQNGNLVFNPLQENTLRFHPISEQQEMQTFALDEKNNIARCFADFRAVIMEEKEDKRSLVLWIANMLEWIRNENG